MERGRVERQVQNYARELQADGGCPAGNLADPFNKNLHIKELMCFI